jgi:tripartite-type tricarboxylate transporter receptor subunit TctC
MRRPFIVTAALLAACGGTDPGEQPEPRAMDFFIDKTVTYIVATNPGGGYDTYARLIARYMEKHLDGVEIRIRNVPGAGNIVGANQLFVAKPDGLTIGTFNTGLIYAQLLRRSGVRFDLRALSWIGKAASDPRVLVASRQSALRSIDDLRGRSEPLLFGSPGLGSAAHTELLFLERLLDIDIRLVGGLGGNGRQMSMLRGETGAAFGSYSAFRRFVENGSGVILLQVGGEHIFGDTVPAADTLVQDAAGETLLSLIKTTSRLGRLTAAPPGTQPGRLAALRSAYAAALSDPDLLAEAARLQIPIDPLFGDEVAALITAALDQPPEDLAVLASVLSR